MDETTRMSLAARLTRIWHWKASETEAEFERRAYAEASALADEIRAQHGQDALEIVMAIVSGRKRAQSAQTREEAHIAMEAAMETEAAAEAAIAAEKTRHG
jgi:hypothetical protein